MKSEVRSREIKSPLHFEVIQSEAGWTSAALSDNEQAPVTAQTAEPGDRRTSNGAASG
jgi:hypothetical protein